MEMGGIVEYLKDKSILVTGSIGFLAKSSDVKKIFLLVKARDVKLAIKRMQNEIPGDMVVNTMLSAVTAHSNQHSEFIYHVSSSVRNLMRNSTIGESLYQYMKKNPRTNSDGKAIKTKRIQAFRTLQIFKIYMLLRYRLPLEGLWLMNLAFFGLFSQQFNKYWKQYQHMIRLADIYGPFALFKGRFDDSNLERLRTAMENSAEVNLFDFDPKNIKWDDYLMNIHIPGVIKYLLK